MTKKKTIFFLGLSGISEEPMFYLDNLTMIFYMQRKKESEAKPNAFIGKTNGLTPDSLTSEFLIKTLLQLRHKEVGYLSQQVVACVATIDAVVAVGVEQFAEILVGLH